MASIEDRIVKIQFDNAQFERKLADTITSIQKLNTTVANAGGRSGLDTITQSARNFSLGPVTSAVQGVSNSFIALSTIAITALATIVSRAVTAGIDIAKALSLDPIISGFQEYELQIGSIQTVLSNTSRDGTTLTNVTDALDELNEYSDKTIYNFGQMTRNIGTFTAAGVDLDTSVMSIKGIANLAAISGSTSEQASSAMYQLSQAIANNKVGLVDWNSVVNAGMGGEVFQRALFETGVAMGTITDAPVGTTFEEWTEAGNSFRGSLEDGWLTGEVLTQTLQGFTGEMTEAQLLGVGYTQAQAEEIMKLGEMGVEAATKVRTLSQLMGTVKESISSGWAQSFRIIFGDFEEATELFTGVSDAIGGMVSRSADARNEMLQGWKDLGGREALIQGLKNGFLALSRVFGPIKEGFREIFPAMTSERLYALTTGFRDFMGRLIPLGSTMDKIKSIATGFFAALKIGWTVIKEGVGFVKDLIMNLLPSGGGGKIFSFLANMGDSIKALHDTLVTGGGIADFFDGLAGKIQPAIQAIKEFASSIIESIKGLFDFGNITESLNSGGVGGFLSGLFGGASGGFDAIKKSFGNVGDIWGPLKKALNSVADILDGAWNTIKDWFSGLGDNLSNPLNAPDFSAVLDTLQVGFLGGITALLLNFARNGFKLDIGGGILDNISDTFSELTGVFSAMQTNLKADALMKIAIAIGVLTASVLVLSMIDPDAMNRALGGLAIGFGQLIGVFALLNKVAANPAAAAKMNLVATSLILIAGAVLILSVAVKLFSMLTWEELAKGLAGVAGSLLLLSGAALILSRASGNLIFVGVGLLAVAASLIIMAGAVKLFSMMDWKEMGKGLAGVAGALTVLAIGMRLMPKGILLQGAGLLVIGAALAVIAGAMKIFATLEWEEMGKGLAAIAGALVGIAIGTKFMGPTLPLVAIGLVGVAASLLIISKVIEQLGGLSWEEIGKGLAGIAGALLAITGAMALGNYGALGAAGILAMSFALTMLIGVIQAFAALSWSSLLRGIGGMAIALGALGLAAFLLSPAVAPLLGIGLALALIGAGFALIGVGAQGLAKAFKIMAEAGQEGVDAIVSLIEGVGETIPEFLENLAEGVLNFLDELMTGLPEIIEKLVEVLGGILDGITELGPKLVQAAVTLISELLTGIRTLFPQFVETGFELIMSILTGIRDNIGEIVIVVTEIITEFLDALSLQIPAVIDSVYNFFIAVITGAVAKLVELGSIIAPKALELIQGLLRGLEENKEEIGNWFRELPGRILGWIGNAAGWLVSTGADLIRGLYEAALAWVDGTLIPWIESIPGLILTGIGNMWDLLKEKGSKLMHGLYNGASEFVTTYVIPFIKGLPDKIFGWIGNVWDTLKEKGSKIINGFYNGVIEFVNEHVIPFFTRLKDKIFTWIGNVWDTLKEKGSKIIHGFYNGIIDFVNQHLIPWFTGLPGKILNWIPNLFTTLGTEGTNLIIGFYNGMVSWINSTLIPWFSQWPSKIKDWVNVGFGTLRSIGSSIIEGFLQGLKDAWGSVSGWLSDRKDQILSLKGPPEDDAVMLYEIGRLIIGGLKNGMEREWRTVASWLSGIDAADAMRKDLATKVSEAVSGLASDLENMDDFNPVITPVLDLTRVMNDVATLSKMLPTGHIYSQALSVAQSQRDASSASSDGLSTSSNGPVTFEQNIYAPKQLSTSDIYRQTKNQIAIAKEELKIP